MGGVVSAASSIVGVATEAVGITTKVVGNAVNAVGSVVDNQLGLDSIGNEVQRWGNDIGQVGDVLSGKYAERSQEVQDKQNALNDRISSYNSRLDALSDRLHSLMAFDEVFKMAVSNKLDTLTTTEGAEITKLTEEVQGMIESLKHDFDFVIGLTQGPFIQKIIGSVIMIVGGITHDMRSLLTGNWDSGMFKRLVVDAIVVIGLILALPSGGSTLPFVLAAIGSFLVLDGMYANGAATSAIMSCLDFIFNDLLNLDNAIGSDFNKFNKDSDGYSEMVGYMKLALVLATIYTAWTQAPTQGVGMSMNQPTSEALRMPSEMSIGEQMTQQAANTPNKELLGGSVSWGGTMENSTAFGVKLTSYTSIYKAYSTAQSIGDAVEANNQYEALKGKLEADMQKVEEQIFKNTNQRFMNAYKDVAYFLQDQQEYVDRYIWSMTAQSMYVDPYGTTPVANIRFTPDKDTRMMSFGYEDVFNENAKAGSKGYFNSIIYG